LPEIQDVSGFQPGFFKKFLKGLLIRCCPRLDESANAVPPTAVMADIPASLEESDLVSPFDDDSHDPSFLGNADCDARFRDERWGCFDDAHCCPYDMLGSRQPLTDGLPIVRR
jgi:hypothetical protein